jgi:hypothetical protein
VAAVESLLVEQAKIQGFLLNADHPEGRSKARFLLGRGFSRGAPDVLAAALAAHARALWPGRRIVSNRYVTKCIVVGPLACPDGSSPSVVAVWRMEPGATVAWLVTADPHR